MSAALLQGARGATEDVDLWWFEDLGDIKRGLEKIRDELRSKHPERRRGYSLGSRSHAVIFRPAGSSWYHRLDGLWRGAG